MSNQDSTDQKPPLHIVRLETQNAMGVRAVAFEPDPSDPLIVIGGDNGAGKTSVIDSIFWAIGGKPSVKRPIRNGEREAIVKVDLGDIVVRRRFRYNQRDEIVSDLEVTNRDGAVYKSPQALLNGLLSRFAFDPGEFVRLRDADQVAAVRRALRLDTADLDAKEADLTDRRRVVNDGLKRLQVRNEGLPSFPDAPDDEVDVAALMTSYREATDHNRQVAEAKVDADRCAERLVAADGYIERQQELVSDLERRLAEERSRLTDMQTKRGEIERLAIEAKTLANAQRPLDLTELEEALAAAEEKNRQVRANRALSEAVDEWNEWEAERADLEKSIERVRQERRDRTADAVTAASLAVEGLEIREGSLWLRGVPFAQCNTETQLRLSVALAIAENPRLRVFRIADGEKITPKNLEVLRRIAADANAQIWMECAVTPEDVAKGFRQVSVLIEDGANVEVPQPELQGVGAK